MPFNDGAGDSLAQQAEALLNGPKPADWLHELHGQQDNALQTKQAATDFAADLAAGFAGTAVYGLSVMSSHGAFKAFSLPMAAMAGSLTKVVVKSAIQRTFLPDQASTVNGADLVWGGVDGVAGVFGGMAEQKAAQTVWQSIGKGALKSMASDEAMELVGKELSQQYVLPALGLNAARGAAGGAVGTLAWSLPRRTYDNFDSLKANPVSGISSLLQQSAHDALVGTVSGAALAGAGTALLRSDQIIGNAVSKLSGTSKLTFIDELSVNDFHSNLDQLPRMKTKADELIQKSLDQGRNTEFVINGDATSGHVYYSFTNDGEVELRGLARVGEKAERIIYVPGNHEYDAPGGRFFPERFPGIIGPVLRDHPKMSLINANLDFSSYPDYKALVKPNITYELQHGPNGPQLAASIGLTTQEGAINGIGYTDAAEVAANQVRRLNQQGIKIITLKAHLDLDESQYVANYLLKNDLMVAKITDGHGHRTLPIHWVSNKTSWLDRLKFWQPTREIPITQGGSSGRWLSQTQLAIRPDGMADRFYTKGTMVPITNDIEENDELRQYINQATAAAQPLRDTTYGTVAEHTYQLSGTRLRETALGNLVADSLHSGVPAADVVLVHSGGIRADIFSGHELSRLDIANTMMSAGDPEAELTELVKLQMTGKQIKSSLEFGVRDFPRQTKPGFGDKFSTLFGDSRADAYYDAPGNFVQVSGLKYSFDLSKDPMNRVSAVEVESAHAVAPDANASANSAANAVPTRSWASIKDDQVYSVVTRYHALDKWNAAQIFGDQSIDATRQMLSATPVKLSQVDMISQYIRDRANIDPHTFSQVEGRIKDLTPRAVKPAGKPGYGLMGLASAQSLAESEGQSR